MKRSAPLALAVVCFMLGLTSCQHTARYERSIATPAPLAPAAPTNSRSLVLAAGPGHSSAHGHWGIEISDDAALHISRLSGSGRSAVSPGDWRAQEGAFVFIENDQRLWAYDGQGHLFLMVSAGKTLASYGPRTFPCSLPQEVAERVGTKPQGPPSGSTE